MTEIEKINDHFEKKSLIDPNVTDVLKNIYGGENNRAWNQHLYLQKKALEIREARIKQVAEAEKWVRELKERRNIKRKRNDYEMGR